MTQEITVVPVDNRTADWPRKVATVLNRLQRTTMLAGGSAVWGSITGTLSAQTDLNSALAGKQATLVSGTNIKSVNGSSLLGSGNLSVGTVTSVAASVPTGFSVAGSPITGSGTLAITFSAGYSLPTDAAQANWNTAFGWGNHASAGYLTSSAIGVTVQAFDADLSALAALTGTNTIYYRSAANTWSAVTIGSGLTFSGGTLSASGGGGGSSSPVVPGGRLTLISVTPVLTSNQTAKTAVYYTPYISDLVPLYSGSAWSNTTFTELSLSLDTTNHASGSLYDVFIWSNSGTVSIGTGPAWSSSSSRGTGAGTTEIERKNGIWTNKNSITLKNGAGSGTSGVSANTALYVGTIYCTANGQTGMNFKPTAAAGGTANILGIYNAYNRTPTGALCRDSTSSWTYATATWRQSNNNANNKISYVDGLGESYVSARFQETCQHTSGAANVTIGTNLNSTSAAPDIAQAQTGTGAYSMTAVQEHYPALGFNYVAAMEYTTGATATYYGFVNSTQMHGLSISLMM